MADYVHVNRFEVHFKMSWFNGDTQKPMVLYTNAKWVEELHLLKTNDTAPQKTLYVMKPDKVTGELRPTGSAGLKTSQAYTEDFGCAMAKLWAKYRRGLQREPTRGNLCGCSECPSVEAILSGPIRDGEDVWADASLVGAFQALQVAALRVKPDAIVEEV